MRDSENPHLCVYKRSDRPLTPTPTPPPIYPLTQPTFHENDEDVSHNAERGDEDEDREEESANGVRNFPLWLQSKQNQTQ